MLIVYLTKRAALAYSFARTKQTQPERTRLAMQEQIQPVAANNSHLPTIDRRQRRKKTQPQKPQKLSVPEIRNLVEPIFECSEEYARNIMLLMSQFEARSDSRLEVCALAEIISHAAFAWTQ